MRALSWVVTNCDSKNLILGTARFFLLIPSSPAFINYTFRSPYTGSTFPKKMATRMFILFSNFIILTFWIFQGLQIENHSDIGVLAKLTNSYCLAAIQGSTNFYSAFESELGDVIPIVHTSIGRTRIIGRLTAGEYATSISPLWRLKSQETDMVPLYPQPQPIRNFSTSGIPYPTPWRSNA